jgi:hypothetical protein
MVMSRVEKLLAVLGADTFLLLSVCGGHTGVLPRGLTSSEARKLARRGPAQSYGDHRA